MFRIFFIALISMILAACSATGPDQAPSFPDNWEQHQSELSKLSRWELNGKMGLTIGESRNSTSLLWLQDDHSYQIDIRGPLGQGGASISGSDTEVVVDIAGEGVFRGPSAEHILYEQLGWYLPITDIYWWIRGLPAPEKPHIHSLENNRLRTLEQNGWDIQYLRYNTLSPALPNKIKLSREGIKMTVIIYSWIAR